MSRWLRRLAAHPRITAGIAVVYLVANILTHDDVQVVAKWIQDTLTPERTNTLVTVLACGILVLAVVLIPRWVRRATHKRTILIYWAATAALLIGIYTMLFMVNTESIHFPQYAILAIMVFPLIGRFGETVLAVTLMGALDEAHQYWVLSRDYKLYMDFNDVILNLGGAAAGVLILALLLPARSPRDSAKGYTVPRFLRSPTFLMTGALALGATALTLMGQIALYEESGAWMVLRRIGPPEEFWQHTYWNKTCHVLMPLEGLAVAAMLIAFYVSLDFKIELDLSDS